MLGQIFHNKFQLKMHEAKETHTKISAANLRKQKVTHHIFLLSDEKESAVKSAVAKWNKEHQLNVNFEDLLKKNVLHKEQDGTCYLFLTYPAKIKVVDQVTAPNDYAWCRDKGNYLHSFLKNNASAAIALHLSQDVTSYENALKGIFVGLELASYQFIQQFKNNKEKIIPIHVNTDKKITAGQQKLIEKYFDEAFQVAKAVQLARHLVNLPPNIVNPHSIEKSLKSEIKFSKNTQIEVWNYERCVKEGLGLLTAVGQGAEHLPRLIKIKYRPSKASGGRTGAKSQAQKTKNQSPLAFVGKGITFDTGGLDIKPSAGMRLMKKDMGGSATVLGLAYWVDQARYSKPCDFYLALAENAVDAKSMRPSDVYKSHAGFLVEVDNTDAEGRLVLADAMSVAVSQKEKPEILIDVATLTGAIKVGLGADVSGLFSNNKSLSEALFEAGQKVGEPNWPMPLVRKYFSSMNSNFADFKNSGAGFGGAITAALFLEKFAGNVPWAHFDIYAWIDSAEGAYSQAGATGQTVQTLIKFLKDY